MLCRPPVIGVEANSQHSFADAPSTTVASPVTKEGAGSDFDEIDGLTLADESDELRSTVGYALVLGWVS